MSLLAAANQALAELKDIHDSHGLCPTPNCCPTRKAIRDLELAIAEATAPSVTDNKGNTWTAETNPDVRFTEGVHFRFVGNGAEATYPAMTVEDVAAAVIEAQSRIGK